MAAKMMASLATWMIARPPARLAMISSSRWSCARASNGNARRTTTKRTSVILHTNGARKNSENTAPRPAMTGWSPAQRKVSHTASRRVTPSGQWETVNLTLSHPDGTNGTGDSLTRGKFALDRAIHFTLQWQHSMFQQSARDIGSKHVTKSWWYSCSGIRPRGDGPSHSHYPAHAPWCVMVSDHRDSFRREFCPADF